jgi:hypothetical protein
MLISYSKFLTAVSEFIILLYILYIRFIPNGLLETIESSCSCSLKVFIFLFF